jgi:choline-sulfatase
VSRPFRYTFILIVVAAAVGLAAAGGWRYARASAPVSGPVIVISIDTLRADHLPAYGYKGVKTPAIDALAADGVLFERAYSHAVETLPAHAALLSGRLPFETGVRGDAGFRIKKNDRLLAQLLRDRGFATGGVVSTPALGKDSGINQGFESFDVQPDGARSEAAAEQWLQAVGTSRAFLFLQLNEPHAPYAPPERYAAYAPYDGEIAYADELVGRLVKYLKSHQLYDRSTIILLSDHGEGLGDHGEQQHGLFLYDEAIHVPLVIKQESNAGAGRRIADVVQHIDIVPTVLDFAKAPGPGPLRGRSLKPVMENGGRLQAATVYSEAPYGHYRFGWSPLVALTDDRHRYISAPRDELYELGRDRGERRNIVDGAAERTQIQVRDAMRSALDRIASGATLQPPAAPSPETRARLQALGYVGSGSPGGVAAHSAADPLVDPKDKVEVVERYRAALDAAADRKWSQAIALLQQVLRDEPAAADLWSQLAAFALRVDRLDQALDAYRHYVALVPGDPDGLLASAGALLKLRKYADAREQATAALNAVGAAGADADGENAGRARSAARAMLARIALAQHDVERARAEANADDTDGSMPIAAYVEGRIAYDQGRYDEAMPSFEQAIGELRNPRTRAVPELYYYAGDTLARLERYHDAEVAFAEELKLYPLNARARGGLTSVYQATGRPDEARQAVAEMLEVTPTPDAYALAVRLLTSMGRRQEADAVRLEARRAFGSTSRTKAVH